MASTTISLPLGCTILQHTAYTQIDQQQSSSLPRMACKTNAKCLLTTNLLFLRDMANTKIFPYAALFLYKILLHTAAKLCKRQQQKKE